MSKREERNVSGNKSPSIVRDFVNQQLSLITLEEAADISERKRKLMLSEQSSKVLNVRLLNSHRGMYGRYLLEFGSIKRTKDVAVHSFRKGDVVGFSTVSSKDECGIVKEVSRTVIVVVVDENPENLEYQKQYILFPAGNLINFKRIKRALRSLTYFQGHRSSKMISTLFGLSNPTSSSNTSLMEIQYINENLNDDQKEAVRFSLQQNESAVIHGPPGTGKTTTLIEIILQMFKRKLKVLACAPSNVATDNLVESLAVYTKNIVRLGHPARTLSGCEFYNIDYLLSKSEYSNKIKEIEDTIDGITLQLASDDWKKQKKMLKNNKRGLLDEKRTYKKIMYQDIFKNSDVILSTLTSASDDGPLSHLHPDHFDVVIIDECPQAIEACCWIPLAHAKKCIIAGDHLQLPPVVMSEKADKEGLGVTLMERLLKIHGDKIKKLLTVQYRMNEKIMYWPSFQLYDGLLKAHENNAHHLLSDILHIQENENTKIPLLLIDTSGSNMSDFESENDSKGNIGEASIVSIHAKSLIESGLDAADIAVITPYSTQVEVIRGKICSQQSKLEISTVDGFQGREKEAVIISLVRSNPKGVLGFLRDDRRINVAITRAKRHLAVVCDCNTISKHPFLGKFMDYMKENGVTRSAAYYETAIADFEKNSSTVPEEKPAEVEKMATSEKCTMTHKGGNPAKKRRKEVPVINSDREESNFAFLNRVFEWNERKLKERANGEPESRFSTPK